LLIFKKRNLAIAQQNTGCLRCQRCRPASPLLELIYISRAQYPRTARADQVLLQRHDCALSLRKESWQRRALRKILVRMLHWNDNSLIDQKSMAKWPISKLSELTEISSHKGKPSISSIPVMKAHIAQPLLSCPLSTRPLFIAMAMRF